MADVGTWYNNLISYFRNVAHTECELQEDHLSCSSPEVASRFTVRLGDGYYNSVDDVYCHVDSDNHLECRTLNGEYGFHLFKNDAGSLNVTRTDAYACGMYADKIMDVLWHFIGKLENASPDLRSNSCTEQ